MTSHKYQDQDAGHQADTQVYGAASGHSVGVEGGTNLVSAGNDETVYYGPALVNTNTNQLPQNNLFIQGSNTGAPISQANTFAGRDMGPKGVFAPIGNTSAQVGGNVGNQSGASVDQSGDSANSIADPMSSGHPPLGLDRPAGKGGLSAPSFFRTTTLDYATFQTTTLDPLRRNPMQPKSDFNLLSAIAIAVFLVCATASVYGIAEDANRPGRRPRPPATHVRDAHTP